MSNFFTMVFIIFVLYLFIGVIWTFAEKKMYGKSTPRFIDDIIALILAAALYGLFWN